MASAAKLPPRPIERVLSPFQRFARLETAGGIILILCTLIAVVAANSPWAEQYHHLWQLQAGIQVGDFAVRTSLHHLINDGLMVVFFFLVGLEIKREVLLGELASVRRAMLPAAAALGGMMVPALLYWALNGGTAGARGWGIPMATDIAFAIGILSMLGSAVPLALKVFLTALAIVDDIGAVVVIALFYTDTIGWGALFSGFAVLAACLLANRLGVRTPWAYIGLGLALWACFVASGVHATVAGVLLAMTIPARTRIEAPEFAARAKALLRDFEHESFNGQSVLTNPDQQEALLQLEQTAEAAQAPLHRIEHDLHSVVAFGIIPLFALANAGVSISGAAGAAFSDRITLGVILGLVIGKPIGIVLFSWLAVRLRMAELPPGVSWRGVHAVSWLGGIGFTMSLFIASLAFKDAALVDQARIGIFVASIAAGTLGWVLLRRDFKTRA